MSVSVSQIGIGRSLDRSIDQSRFPGQSLDQSICVCRYLYKEQHPPTRALTSAVKILRLVDLFSILFISSHQPLAHPYTAYPRKSRTIVHTSRSHREDRLADPRTVARPPAIAAAHIQKKKEHRTEPRTRRRIHDAGRTKSRGRESAHEMWRSTHEEGRETGTERRTMHRRPTWVPRAKLTRNVNCLSNLSSPPPLCIYRYINILCIYVHIHIYVYVCMVCACVLRERDERMLGVD